MPTIPLRLLFAATAGPSPSSTYEQTFTVNDELMLKCVDESASPEVEATWSFTPSGEAPPADKHPLILGNFYPEERENAFM